MALATQCPHCHTTFRVAHDQLKLRAGLVRCGSCKQIFNGIENLLRPEELARTSTPPAGPSPAPAEPQPPTQADLTHATTPGPTADATRDQAESAQEPDTSADEVFMPAAGVAGKEEAIVADGKSADPLLRMTLVDFDQEMREPVEGAPPSTPAPDALEQTIADLQNKPWREEPDASGDGEADALDRAEAAEYEEPAFVTQARRRQRIGRALRIFMAAGSAVLLCALLAQGAYVFRDRLAARFPQARPALVEACAHLGCQVGLPAQIDSVSIESSELQALPANGNTFTLTLLLRNQAATAQAWPHVELTLNDANEKAMVRRVFTPREYLPAARELNDGFAPDSEQPIKLFFELSQPKASGYRVYLFYP